MFGKLKIGRQSLIDETEKEENEKSLSEESQLGFKPGGFGGLKLGFKPNFGNSVLNVLAVNCCTDGKFDEYACDGDGFG